MNADQIIKIHLGILKRVVLEYFAGFPTPNPSIHFHGEKSHTKISKNFHFFFINEFKKNLKHYI